MSDHPNFGTENSKRRHRLPKMCDHLKRRHLQLKMLVPTSAWKSGPVRFFIQIWEDRDRDRSSWLEIPQNRDRNRQRPVHSGFTRFLAVFNRSQTGFAGGSSVKI